MPKKKRDIVIVLVWGLVIAGIPPALLLLVFWLLLKTAIQGRPPQSGFSFWAWIFSVLLLGSLSALPAGSISQVKDWLSIPGNAQAAIGGACIMSIVGLTLLLATFRKPQLFKTYFPVRNFRIDFKLIFLILFSASPVLGWLFKIKIDQLENPWQIAAAQVFLQNSSLLSVLSSFIFICVLAPIFEEFVFRGLLASYFLERNNLKKIKWTAILIPSVLFGLGHPYFILAFFFSLALFYVKNRYQNILTCCFLHMLWNFSIIAWMYSYFHAS